LNPIAAKEAKLIDDYIQHRTYVNIRYNTYRVIHAYQNTVYECDMLQSILVRILQVNTTYNTI